MWWWGRKALRLGAVAGGPADVGAASDGVTRPSSTAAPRGAVRGPRVGALVSRESVEAGGLRLARYRPPAAELAPDQLAAVAHGHGPARVIAPAGSGKTRVLTERLRHLLGDQGWEPSCVTAVAFNKRAADELVARTEGLGTHVRTIHALGLAILTGGLGGRAPAPRRARRAAGPARAREPARGAPAGQHRRPRAVPRRPLGHPHRPARPGAAAERDLPDAAGLAELWPRYRDALDRAGAIDFDDQVERAIRVLLTDPAARAEAQVRCRHLLVDEFQDLAPAHLLLLRLLSAPAYDVFGVGDDDQVIYGYAGATTGVSDRVRGVVPRGGAVRAGGQLPVPGAGGRRRPASCSRYNSRRIAEDHPRPGGDGAGAARGGRRPRRRRWRRPRCAWSRGAAATGAPPDEMAVLTRVNSTLLPVQVALLDAGDPHHAPARRARPRADRRAGRAGVAARRARSGSIARADLAETIRRPSRRVSRNVVDMLTKRATNSVRGIRGLGDRLSGGDVAEAGGVRRRHRRGRRGPPVGARRRR